MWHKCSPVDEIIFTFVFNFQLELKFHITTAKVWLDSSFTTEVDVRPKSNVHDTLSTSASCHPPIKDTDIYQINKLDKYNLYFISTQSHEH